MQKIKYFTIVIWTLTFGLVVCSISTVLLINANKDVDKINITNNGTINIHEQKTKKESELYEAFNKCLKAEAKLGNDDVSIYNENIYLLLKLQGVEDCGDYINQINPSVDISIVIDRSGSMYGDKLENVKKAVINIGQFIDENDSLSVVIYDDEVETIYYSDNEGFNKEKFENVISGIYSRGMTYLEGGLREGLNNVQMGDGSNKYVILLSDGVANVGEIDPEILSSIKSDYNEEIRISTIGVGADFNEKVMTSIARKANGNYYFLESSVQAEEIFHKEFLCIKNIYASNITVNFEFSNGYILQRGIGYEMDNLNSFNPYPVVTTDPVEYLFEIKVPEHEEYGTEAFDLLQGKREHIVDIIITFSNQRDFMHDDQLNISIDANFDTNYENPLADEEVYFSYINNVTAEKKYKIYQELDQTQNSQAITEIEDLLNELNQANIRTNGAFDKEVSEIEIKKEYILKLGDSNVNSDEDGRMFQKSNQFEYYEIMYNK